MDLVDKLEETVREIHAGKEVHSFADLKRVLTAVNRTTTEGLRVFAYEPYFSILNQVQTFVADIDLDFIKGSGPNIAATCEFPSYVFKFIIPQKRTAHDYIRRIGTGINQKLTKFQNLFDDVSERVEISIMPSEDGGIETF